jgi:hypothetical protein
VGLVYYLKFKLNPTQLTLDSIQPLASKLGENPGKFMVTYSDVMNNFCYWLDFNFEMEFELKFLGPNQF